LLFRVGVSTLLVVWLVRLGGTAEIRDALARADIAWLGLVVILSNADRVLMAYKWNLLLLAKRIELPLVSIVRTYYKAVFLGLVGVSVAPDVYRVAVLSRQTKRFDDVMSSVVVERLLGLISLGVVAVISATLFAMWLDQDRWSMAMQVIAVVVLLSTLFLLSLSSPLARFTERLLHSGSKTLGKLGRMVQSYYEYARHRRTLLTFFGWSTLEQFSPIITTFLTAKALHLDVPVLSFVIFVPLVVAIVRLPLPIAFDGIGLREGLLVYLFSLVGVPRAEAFLLGFLHHIVGWLALTPALFYILASDGRQRARRMKPQ
jgi:uncharacterized protein (TIRG00374 family)